MNVNGISGAVRATAPVAPVAAAQPVETATRDPRSSALVEIDAKTQQPVPLRFPWLSRLSQQLGEASGKPAPFAGAPEIGDSVDTKA